MISILRLEEALRVRKVFTDWPALDSVYRDLVLKAKKELL